MRRVAPAREFHPPAWAKRSRRRGSTASTSPLDRARAAAATRWGEPLPTPRSPSSSLPVPSLVRALRSCQRPFRCSTNTGGRRSPGRREPGVASRRRVARRRSRRNVTRSQRLAWRSHPDEHGRCLLSQRPCKRGASGPLSNGVEPRPVNRSISAQTCRSCWSASGGVGLSIGFASRRPPVRIPARSNKKGVKGGRDASRLARAPRRRASHGPSGPARCTRSLGNAW